MAKPERKKFIEFFTEEQKEILRSSKTQDNKITMIINSNIHYSNLIFDDSPEVEKFFRFFPSGRGMLQFANCEFQVPFQIKGKNNLEKYFKNINFQNCIFTKGLIFQNINFQNVIKISNNDKTEKEDNAEIPKFVIKDCRLGKNITFQNINFQNIKITNTDFVEQLNFDKCNFYQGIDLRVEKPDVIKDKLDNYNRNEPIRYDTKETFINLSAKRCVFHASAYFSKLKLKGPNFSGSVFKDTVEFKLNIFLNKSLFHNTQFDDLVDFSCSKFKGDVEFYDARAKSALIQKGIFRKVIFESNTVFTNICFNMRDHLRSPSSITSGIDNAPTV